MSSGRGRPAGCGGGSAAAPGPLSGPLGASSHTSPPPAPSVRSREYPPPPSPHLLLPRRPLAPRGRPLSPGGSPGPGPTTGRGWMGRPEPRGAEGRVRGLKLGFRCPEARRTEQCGHRRTWPARPTERRRRRRGQETEGAAAGDLLLLAAGTWGIAAEAGSGAVCGRQIGVAKLGGSWGAGEVGPARTKGDNEMDRWHQSGVPPG